MHLNDYAIDILENRLVEKFELIDGIKHKRGKWGASVAADADTPDLRESVAKGIVEMNRPRDKVMWDETANYWGNKKKYQ